MNIENILQVIKEVQSNPDLTFFLFTPSLILAMVISALLLKKILKKTNSQNYEQKILDLIEEPVLTTNSSNKIKYINHSALSLLKTSKEEITGKNIFSIIQLLGPQEILNSKAVNVKINNDLIKNIQITAWNKYDQKNRPIGINIIFNNSESEIQESRNKLIQIKNEIQQIDTKTNSLLKTIEKNKNNPTIKNCENIATEHSLLLASLNNLTLGFIMIDKQLKISFINPAAKKIISAPKDPNSLNTYTLMDLQSKISTDINFKNEIEKTLQTGKTNCVQNISINNMRHDIFISPITKQNSNIPEVIGNIIILEDKTQERLLNRSKENFFTIASHELRTPLTGIRGYISIIKDYYTNEIKEPELKRIINDIDISSNRLINIVNDFLDKSKIEEDKIEVHPIKCDLIPLITSSIKDTNSLSLEKKLSVNFNNQVSSVQVLGDPDKIKQILINLLSNSIKYTDRGSITVNVEKDNNICKVLISDTGKGIAKENISQLFSKYQKNDPNKKQNIVSSGLGLYISKLLANKMNGDIKLEKTEEGKGSTFGFTIPIFKEAS